jgi:hypothetical protein
VEGRGRTLLYRYRLDLEPGEVSPAEMADSFYRSIAPAICSRPEMREQMERGVSFRYAYATRDGSPLYDTTVGGSACPYP